MKILVVEDKPKHLQDAVRVLQEAAVEVVTADDCESAEMLMWETHWDKKSGKRVRTPIVDGVITDIFLPWMKRNEELNNDNCPVGILVAAQAYKIGIPFVFCTDGHHHAASHEWINWLCKTMEWPAMVDDNLGGEKGWLKALDKLRKLIEKQKNTIQP